MSRLATAWLVASIWALSALLHAIDDVRVPSIVICSLGLFACLLNVGTTWRADRR